MNRQDIALLRQYNQLISQSMYTKPSEIVKHLGAIQAQDYLGSLWALALRLPTATEKSIEESLAKKEIVRTWPMRGTLHFVPPQDAKWMLQLLTPRVISSTKGRYRQLELTDEVFQKARNIFIKALQGGKMLTRSDMYQTLEKTNITTKGQRGIHILCRLSQEGLLCFGARIGKQHTFVLLDEWIPKNISLKRDEALATLAKRYFTSHGPATLQDFVWWTGLTVQDAKIGLDQARKKLISKLIEGKTYWMSPRIVNIKRSSTLYLLPSFDEFLVAYKDRTAALNVNFASKIYLWGNGIMSPVIIQDGKLIGTWRREVKKDKVILSATFFNKVNNSQYKEFIEVAQRYGKFLDLPIDMG